MPISSIYVINNNLLKCFYPYVRIKQLPKHGDKIEIFFKQELIIYKVLDVITREDKCHDMFLSDNLEEANYYTTVTNLKQALNINCEENTN